MVNKKVLHVITRLIHGGADQNTILTCIGLKVRGWDVILVTGADVTIDLEEIKTSGVKVIMVDSLIRNIHPISDIKALLSLYKICVFHKPDIVHTHTAKAGILGRLSARLAGIKKVVHGVHGSPVDSVDNPLKKKALSFIEGRTAAINSYYVTVGEDIFTKYCEQSGMKKKENCKVVRSAFNVDEFVNSEQYRITEREKLGLDNEKIAIGMIGRVAPQKGYEYYIDLCKLLDANNSFYRFYAAGKEDNQSYSKKIKDLMKQYFEDDIFTLLGQISYDYVPKFISAMDIIVHTAMWEGVPRVVVESLISNKPVICFDVEGAAEVIEDGINGFIVPKKDVLEMYERVNYLVHEIGINNFNPNQSEINERLIEDFSIKTMIDGIEDVYARVKS